MSKITKDNEVLIKAKVLDHLIEHLQKRTDVQNIDLMNLSGFCRNCLSKWYAKYAYKAKLKGYISGTEEGMFEGGRDITRAEMAKIVSLASY